MDYWHFNFICPYFKWDKQTQVGCEGKHTLKFAHANEARNFLKSYCAGWKWKQCPHAAKMNKYYEEKNDGKSQERKSRTERKDK